jgi:hypothetical protein
VNDRLVDDLELVLAGEPFGLSCDGLAKRLHRKRELVLVALRSDVRFEHEGRTRESRWRLASGVGLETRPIPLPRPRLPWSELDPSGVPLAGREAHTA